MATPDIDSITFTDEPDVSQTPADAQGAGELVEPPYKTRSGPRPQKKPVEQQTQENMRTLLSGDGTLTAAEAGYDRNETPITNVSITGVAFRSPVALPPGTIRYLRTSTGEAKLASRIRVMSCRLRGDGHFDCKAEFF